MPLERVEVRNEYALGALELYGEVDKEDPKEILEGVAAAGLVGVLRQLGDLADFAADVFHELQEELMTTFSRSRKLMSHVRQIEAALSPLEKAVLAQSTHLHFAYTTGLDWHAHIQCQKNHFVYSDVPQFIKDSYEDCRDPPNLYLLDRFDTGGPGSCLKRYTDPTLFKEASMVCVEVSNEKISNDKKGCRIKKRRSQHRNGEVHRHAPFLYNNGRVQLSQPNIGGHPSPIQTKLEEQSHMIELRNGSDCSKGDSRPSYSVQPDEQDSRESFSSTVNRHNGNVLDYNILDDEKMANAYYDIQINPSQEQAACSPSSVTVNEKGETLEHIAEESDNYGLPQEDDYDRRPLASFSPDLNLQTLSDSGKDLEVVGQSYQAVPGQESSDVRPDGLEFCNQVTPALESSDIHVDTMQSCNQAVVTLEPTDVHLDDTESGTDQYMDALNYAIESEGESDADCMRKGAVEHSSKIEDKGVHHVACESELTSHILEHQSSIAQPVDFANGSPSNANGEQSSHLIKGVAMKDEIHSVSLVYNDFRTSLLAGKSSLNLVGSLSAESCGNGGINDRSHMADEASSCMKSHKNASDTSSSTVTSVTFWTNGVLLGLQPSKPPDCSISNGVQQDPVFNNNGENSVSFYQEENLKICHQSFSGGKDPLGCEFPTVSPPPSPPLKHMKISFQPIDAFQTSKLKLKFPDGNTDCGSSSNIFPSFQLVPEAFVTLGSDSDADTFYRSPSDTDDHRSNQTDSDSELWEARQSPTTKDHELYDALGRFSLTASVPTVPENRNSGSCTSSNLHSFESLNHAYPASEPQRTTPQPDVMDSKSKPMHSYHAYEPIIHSASSHSRPKPAPSNEDDVDASNVRKSKSGLRTMNGRQRKDDQGKSTDENDFLSQIRTKSFNLRRTPTAKPIAVPSGASVNAQVTAILEKADAIRQAVGSEEEDDGEWSD